MVVENLLSNAIYICTYINPSHGQATLQLCYLYNRIISLLKIVIIYLSERPPLWSSGQSFWLQIQRSRVRFPALPVVGLERGLLSLVSLLRSTEELLE